MDLRTWLRFLIGDPEAIRTVATTRHLLWLGLIAVCAAALAREYDGVDLIAEPWHLALPLAASLGSSLILFLLTMAVAWFRGVVWHDMRPRYAQFLAVYWATAPLAWLYAIPVERFMSSGNAARANLALLGFVAAWRVFIMIRALPALLGASHRAAIGIVMLFGDALLYASFFVVPIPIVSIMGGVRLSEAELIIMNTMYTLAFLSMVSMPVWAGMVLGACWFRENRWQWSVSTESRGGVSAAAWGLAGLALLAGLVALPITQPPQRRATTANRLLLDGDIRGGLDYLSRFDADDFPSHWEPPPHLAYGKERPDLWQVLEWIAAERPAPWVRDLYVDKLRRFRDEMGWHHWGQDYASAGTERFLHVLGALPESTQIMRDNPGLVDTLGRIASEQPQYRDVIGELLQRVGVELPPRESVDGAPPPSPPDDSTLDGGPEANENQTYKS